MKLLSQEHGNSSEANTGDFSSLPAGASDIAREVEERLAKVGAIVKSVITNRPVLALGAALAAGVFLGWMIKRR
jgi:hypothetical protein